MRAWRLHALGEPAEVLRLDHVGIPTPARDEVLVKVSAAGLNFPDLLLCRGQYQERPRLPFVPGFEAAGSVVATGGQSDLRIGESVVVLTRPPAGSFAEYVAVPPSRVLAAGDRMGPVTGAAFGIAYHTAWVALHRRARLKPGEMLLVHGGAGGVGSAAIQLGAAAEACVIATARGHEKVAACSKLGADHVIDTAQGDFVIDVLEWTGGRGADVIFDPVGGETFVRSTCCIAMDGRLLRLGFAGGEIPSVAVDHVALNNYSVVGVHQGLYHRERPEVVTETHAALLQLHEAGSVSPLVDRVLPFTGLVEGLRRLESRGVCGKVVLAVDETVRAGRLRR